MSKVKYPYKIIFYPSESQDPSTITSTDLGTAQRYLFSQQAGVNDDAEIQVLDVSTGRILGGYFYRMTVNGKWQLIRALEIA